MCASKNGGLVNKDIAARLGISEHTVKFHISSILDKLDASTRTEAVSLGNPEWANSNLNSPWTVSPQTKRRCGCPRPDRDEQSGAAGGPNGPNPLRGFWHTFPLPRDPILHLESFHHAVESATTSQAFPGPDLPMRVPL
jgi:hypothetical protein